MGSAARHSDGRLHPSDGYVLPLNKSNLFFSDLRHAAGTSAKPTKFPHKLTFKPLKIILLIINEYSE
jgi:hypothetical protein